MAIKAVFFDIGNVLLRFSQKRILRKIYDNPAGTRQAIISFPRKNAKTTLIAFLLLLHLCGPEPDITCLDLSVTEGRANITVEGYTLSPEPVDILRVASWLLGAYLELTEDNPPRELVNPLAVEMAAQVLNALVDRTGADPAASAHNQCRPAQQPRPSGRAAGTHAPAPTR